MSAIQPAIRSAIQPAIRSALASSGAAVWSPLDLFAASEVGVWYDPSDFSTMYQDSAGTTPVTAVGDPVGLILDKSKGLVLGSELAPSNTFDSTVGWATVSNWTISGGSATHVPGSAASQYSSVAPLTVGKTYLVTASVTVSAGGIQLLAGSSGGSGGITASGDYTFRLLCIGDGVIRLTPTSTAFSGSIETISVKEIAGNHAYQATAASRPILGRTPATGQRNLLTYTEQFDNAAWKKAVGATVTANSTVAPDGTTTADTVVYPAAPGYVYLGSSVFRPSTTYTLSVWAKSVSGTQSIQMNAWDGAATAQASKSVTTTWTRLEHTFTTAAGAGSGDLGFRNGADLVARDVVFWGAQLELGSSATAYQKVAAAYDVTEAGVEDRYCLYFDGTDDWLSTAAIDFTATDEISIFSGARKNSDAAANVLIELSASMASNVGTFILVTKNTATQLWASGARGDAAFTSGIFGYSTQAAPDTAVITSLHDISGDLSTFRRNGVAATSSTDNKGTGNFGNYALYIGRRGGTTLPFKGNLYPIIIRGALSSAEEIAAAEAYVNSKTGAY